MGSREGRREQVKLRVYGINNRVNNEQSDNEKGKRVMKKRERRECIA